MIIDEEIKRIEKPAAEFAAYPNVKQSINLGLYFLLFSIIAALPIDGFKRLFAIHSKTGASSLMLASYGVAAIATIAFGFYRYRKVEGVNYRFKFNKFPVPAMVVAVFMILTMPVLTDPLNVLLPMPDSMKKMFDDMFDPNIVSYLTVIVAAPILEETIFRGIILNGLLKNLPPQKAIIISAAIFGVIHLNPWQAIPAFLGALIMGWMYWKTRSIVPGMILHFANNLFSVLLGIAFKDADTLKQLMSTQAYIALFVLCAAISIGGWLFLEQYFENHPTVADDDDWDIEYAAEE